MDIMTGEKLSSLLFAISPVTYWSVNHQEGGGGYIEWGESLFKPATSFPLLEYMKI